MVPFIGKAGNCLTAPSLPPAPFSLPQLQTAVRQDTPVELDTEDLGSPNLTNSLEMNPSSSTEKGGARTYPHHAAFSYLAKHNGVTPFSLARDFLCHITLGRKSSSSQAWRHLNEDTGHMWTKASTVVLKVWLQVQ